MNHKLKTLNRPFVSLTQVRKDRKGIAKRRKKIVVNHRVTEVTEFKSKKKRWDVYFLNDTGVTPDKNEFIHFYLRPFLI